METLEEYLDKIKYTKEVNKDVKASIQKYYSKINNNDPEEQIKAYIIDMIKVFPEYETRLNEKGIDLVVKHDKKVVSIFECKSVTNKNEMIEEDDINKKALWELILNFALLYSENSFPKYMVATNGKKWFVFNNRPFKRLIENESARISFGLGTDMLFPEEKREDIYKHIKEYLDYNSEVLADFKNNCYYFSEVASKDIVEDICKFLSPDIMLGKYNPNVGNVLNKDFYDELLYIFGLKEEEKNGKKTIVPNGIPNTFYSQINSKLNNYDKSIELIIIWLNRILFLKLFEARLISFNNDYSFSFLNKDKIPDTATLETLFFDVLAVSEQKREQFAKSFDYIPYLNSSLFEEKEIEKDFPISKIRGNAPVKYFDKTILKDKESKKRKTGDVPLLDYLFEFLNAYNFGEEGNPSSLISPAVLGLVFEKING